MPIKGLIFDAYGTLYDVHSVETKCEQLCPGKGDLITQIWRLKQLEYTWLQTALQDYRDFGFITEASLLFALRAAGVEPSESIIKPLLDKYLDLDPFPEAREALGALRRRGGYQLAILSNGTTAMLTAETILVTHYPNIIAALGKDWFDVKEGDASIFRPDNGSYKLLARIQMDEWPRIAAAAKPSAQR